MASVSIVSDDALPLMRDVNFDKQPERSMVYSEWARAFAFDLPRAIKCLPDVIEDVYAFELWKDKYLDTPEQFFERMGIFGLDLDEPARLIRELREKNSSKSAEIQRRISRVIELKNMGWTQQAIADEVGVHRNTIASDLCTEKSVYTQKTVQPRKVTQYKISEYTKPETAAEKIHAKFGPEFAHALKEAL